MLLWKLWNSLNILIGYGIKWKIKNITVETVPKCSRKIVERGKIDTNSK